MEISITINGKKHEKKSAEDETEAKVKVEEKIIKEKEIVKEEKESIKKAEK